ncbi:MAG: efflux RND transporter periplasmic adaptor subunit [Pirellulales bacterium]
MPVRGEIMRGWQLLGITIVCVSLAGGCGSSATAGKSSEPPAKVAEIANEEKLNTIELTPQAAERLGIETAQVEHRALARVRTYGGEVTLPPGASIIVSAPLPGTLQTPPDSLPVKAGVAVEDEQPILSLLPLLSPERDVLTPTEKVNLAQARNLIAQSQIDAAAQVQQAEVQVEAAQIVLARAERLLSQQAGTVRAVDDAKAQLELASKTLKAAKIRQELMEGIQLDAEKPGQQEPLTLVAPQAGIVRSLHVAAGEVVAAGAPLFEIMDGRVVWIKTPVYVGELDEIAEEADARVSSLADTAGGTALTATPISAPPTALPLASAVDLYYRLDNSAGALRPGQRVGVQLKLKGTDEDRLFAWSAVIHDIQGGTWVYEQAAPLTYVRRRVQVRHVIDGWAVLRDGPPVGASIVTAGAMELFGTEFGFAK